MPAKTPGLLRHGPALRLTEHRHFAAHRATEVHAAAEPVFTDLIAAADVTIGETVMATGLGG